jgi:hypothetical protein
MKKACIEVLSRFFEMKKKNKSLCEKEEVDKINTEEEQKNEKEIAICDKLQNQKTKRIRDTVNNKDYFSFLPSSEQNKRVENPKKHFSKNNLENHLEKPKPSFSFTLNEDNNNNFVDNTDVTINKHKVNSNNSDNNTNEMNQKYVIKYEDNSILKFTYKQM